MAGWPRWRRAGPGRSGFVPGLPGLILLAGSALLPHVAIAAQPIQWFGPGRVSCQRLGGASMDCLLTADRVTDGQNVASFGVALLPPRDQVLFRKWCLAGSDACTVTVAGRRASPRSTRLSTVVSVRWVRLSTPENDAVPPAQAQRATAR